ncbi:30S ribosomal protein S9 [bacterium (Candidatus Gribaldobacteria) CG_4_9_14_3_um_filter_36_15]|uniref:Small ribosomal subunit protein uS9 n=3 Tax=Candidatus Gribaldobacteria TaxID=2798536 RepID=A0A2M7VKE5_9BACT|nr:MAG: 30S ribosomal protein S9 [bacterium (Candidatus Gribaldobacteria) CG10_big_fil_rev_8_21_14_0_10_37_46]PJA02236.1 MAG: 30S ribosomal protein S9 [bacterium (Candidatus Gribaldobacteria) CG_4_10_14_0_2_um_filter_36_18]PJB09201.1 MAG: 30S ribosomal protein S9 [bacterium (Candidatus Gribaldobacteria) CG_4_9_14_3_um_filter_36_15]
MKKTAEKTTKKISKKTTPSKLKAKRTSSRKRDLKPKKTVKKERAKKEKLVPVKYFEAIGRRKTAQARVRLFTQGQKEIKVNEKPYKTYFPTNELQKIIESPLESIKCLEKFGVSIHLKGGGFQAQAEAARHGISRALCFLNPYFKKKLRKSGFLTRDSRMRERKKFGLKRARRAPQWSKR